MNAVLYGVASPLLAPPGVRWVANPSYLYVALISSILTFFAWPYYCEQQADHYIDNIIGKKHVDQTGNIPKQAFMEAWRSNDEFRRIIRDALPQIKSTSKLLSEWKMLHQGKINETKNQSNTAELVEMIQQQEDKDGEIYFDVIDEDHSGDISHSELMRLVERRFYNGWETYLMDTLGLSSLSIAAVIMATRGGMHPVVAATSGVTVCFGGILRDLLCGRDLAIGSQSYAFATGASSTVYVFLRELALRRIVVLPLALRTFLSAGTCVLLRGWEWIRGEPLLRPMHGRHKETS